MYCLRKLIPFSMWLALAGTAAAQESSWEAFVAAGQSAFQAGDYDQAREKFDAALRVAESFSELDTRLATTLNNIAAVYYVSGDYVAAEPLFRRALGIRERSLGRDHVEVATSLNNLAAVHRKQGDLSAAVPALERALGIREQALGPTHPSTLAIIDNLAAVHRELGQDGQSEALLRLSLDRRRQAGRSDPDAEASLYERLADIQQDQGRYGEAVESLGEAIAQRRQSGADVTHLKTQVAAIQDMTRSANDRVAEAPAGVSRPQARSGPLLAQILVPQTPIGAAMPVARMAENAGEAVKPVTARAALPGTTDRQAPPRKPTMAVVAARQTVDEPTNTERYFLQLISLKSEDRVQTEWMRLRDVHAEVLGALPADVIRADLGDHGVWYRLQAGPMTAFDTANAACASLAASDQACLVVER